MRKLTRERFEKMPLHQRTEVYFNHELNTTQGKNRSEGPTTVAQGAFHSDWRQAFSEFANRLDSRD